MKVYRIKRDSLTAGALYEIREVAVTKTPGGYRSSCNRRIPALDKPDVKVKLIVYSEDRDTYKMDRLCEKIRKAVEEYNGR